MAERIATLDLVSGGRVEWGTGESSSLLELGGFGVPVEQKRAMWREATEQAADMLALDPYPGCEGEFFSMPCRNVVPKPVQRPHPPLWVACSNRETIKLAARLGIGALTFAFVDPDEAKQWVDDYYRILEEECVPIGHAVNANVCMVSGFGVHADPDVAHARFRDGLSFFRFALGWHYGSGVHKPGRTSIWEQFEAIGDSLAELDVEHRGIGTPAQVRERLRQFAEAGVDQVVFIQQAGRNDHEHICEALELFAREVLPEFAEGQAAADARKAERLAPHVAAALERKQRREPLRDADIPTVAALGRSVTEQG